MTLYCHACKANHRFTPGEVERLVYALLGPGWRYDGVCLRTSESWAARLEPVQTAVENRRLAAKEEG